MKTIGIIGLGVMGASFAARLSQQGISVIGFDDRDIASYFSPRLTTIALPLKEIGQQSVSMLLDLCKDGKAFSNDIRLQCVLVERESVRSIG